MPSNDDLIAAIDAKLSALIELAVESGPHPVANGPAARANAPLQPPPPEPTPGASGTLGPPTATPPGADLVEALDEIARLLALSLKRKRDLADVVADLDSVGIDRARVSELLGISPSHVDAALVAYDRRARRGRKKRR